MNDQTTWKDEPEIIQGVVVEAMPERSTSQPMPEPCKQPFVIAPQDVNQLFGLFIGIAAYELLRWALWRGYDHFSDS